MEMLRDLWRGCANLYTTGSHQPSLKTDLLTMQGNDWTWLGPIKIERSGGYAVQRRILLLIALSTQLFVSSAFTLQCIGVTFWKWIVTSNFASSLARLPQGATFVVL